MNLSIGIMLRIIGFLFGVIEHRIEFLCEHTTHPLCVLQYCQIMNLRYYQEIGYG